MKLCYNTISGVWYAAPLFEFKSMMCLLYNIAESNPNTVDYLEMDTSQKKYYDSYTSYINASKSYWRKPIYNFLFKNYMKFIKMFPLIAWYHFGYKNALVRDRVWCWIKFKYTCVDTVKCISRIKNKNVILRFCYFYLQYISWVSLKVKWKEALY